MKKIIILFLCVFALTSVGQTTMTGSGDTITNTGTDYVQLQVKRDYKTLSIQAKVTKISGTVAGTALLSGSNDGVNFINIGIDTLTLTNVNTNTKIWILDGSPYSHYRVTFLGSGTQSSRIYGYLLGQSDPGSVAINSINTPQNLLSTYSLTLDTVTNAGANTLLIRVSKPAKTISIQAVVTKLSGTAAGTVTLQGSNDGLNFVTVSTNFLKNIASLAPYTTSGTATLTVTNQTTNTKLFAVNGSPYLYYRLSYTGSGTMVCTLKGYLLASK